MVDIGDRKKDDRTDSASSPDRNTSKDQSDDEDNKEEKLEAFKGNKGGGGSGSSGGGNPVRDTTSNSDIENLLYALGNVHLYIEGVKHKSESEDNKRSEMYKELASNFESQLVEFYGVFDVQKIAEKHGMDWEKDVLEHIIEHQDLGDVV